MLPAILIVVIGLLLIERRKVGKSRQELEQSKRFSQRVAETLPSVLFVYDLAEQRNIYVNHQSSAVLGYTDEEVIRLGDKFLLQTMHPDDLARLPSLAAEYLGRKDGEVFEHIFRLRHKNGEWRWIHRCATIFARAADGRPRQIVGTATDITKLKIAEEELRSLSLRLLNIQDEERGRIARELHDGTAQDLFVLTMCIAGLQRRNDLPPAAVTALEECKKICDGSLQEVRTLSYLLHPPVLDDKGLAGALQTFVDGFSRRSGIEIDLKIADGVGRLLPAIERDLFRVVQEGLANIARHSGSRRAIVAIEQSGHVVALTIKDFGRGMPPSSQSEGGVGITSMRERLRHVGGSFEIQSSGEGTTLIATVPLSRENTAETSVGALRDAQARQRAAADNEFGVR
jgi:PAS domain S-box-containing protein